MYCIEKIEDILESKLIEAIEKFGDRTVRIIDIGVFPWHSEISLSFLFSDDSEDEDDIADWPYYDFSEIHEGKWEQAKELAAEMNEIWLEDNDAFPIFMDFASAATSDRITKVMNRFNLAQDFRIQILDPDNPDSNNFCD